MGRYKDYDRGPKRGGYDDDQKFDDPAAAVRPNYPRLSASAERRPASASQVVGATSESIGTVKVYKADKGFGFAGQDDLGKDVFIHASALFTGRAEWAGRRSACADANRPGAKRTRGSLNRTSGMNG